MQLANIFNQHRSPDSNIKDGLNILDSIFWLLKNNKRDVNKGRTQKMKNDGVFILIQHPYKMLIGTFEIPGMPRLGPSANYGNFC